MIPENRKVEHHQDDQHRADAHGQLGAIDRVGPEERPDPRALPLDERCGERAGPEHVDQVLGLAVQGLRVAATEVDDAVATGDRAVDDRRGVHLLVEDDGHLAAYVLGREAAEAAGAVTVELDLDLRLPGGGVGALVGRLDRGAGELAARRR